MQLSPKTLEILQNFATINKSILFLEGNLQRIISPTESVYADVTLIDTFPKEFAIYDLPKFLGVLSLFEKPDLNFHEDSVSIEEKSKKIVYKYCKPEIIKFPPKGKNIALGDVDVSVSLSKETIKNVLKADSIFSHGSVAFEGDGEKVIVKTYNVDAPDNDGYFETLGVTEKKFLFVINVNNLPLLMDDYDVTITSKMFIKFDSKANPLSYICACERKQSFIERA